MEVWVQDISRKVPVAWLLPMVVGLEYSGQEVSQLAANIITDKKKKNFYEYIGHAG